MVACLAATFLQLLLSILQLFHEPVKVVPLKLKHASGAVYALDGNLHTAVRHKAHLPTMCVYRLCCAVGHGAGSLLFACKEHDDTPDIEGQPKQAARAGYAAEPRGDDDAQKKSPKLACASGAL